MVGGSGEISPLPPTIFVMITNQKWQLYRVSFPSVFIAEIMPYGVISVIIWGRFFPYKHTTKVRIFLASPKSTSKSPLQISVGQIRGEITK